jgi:hypothetical protein
MIQVLSLFLLLAASAANPTPEPVYANKVVSKGMFLLSIPFIQDTNPCTETEIVIPAIATVTTRMGITDTVMVMIDRSAAAVITREDIKMVMGITDTVMVMVDRSAAMVTTREDIERVMGITDTVMVMIDRSAAVVTIREDIERVIVIMDTDTDMGLNERTAIKATNREESAGIRLARLYRDFSRHFKLDFHYFIHK